MVTNNHLSRGEDLNMIVALAVAKALKRSNKSKDKSEDNSNLENYSNHFNFEKSRL